MNIRLIKILIPFFTFPASLVEASDCFPTPYCENFDSHPVGTFSSSDWFAAYPGGESFVVPDEVGNHILHVPGAIRYYPQLKQIDIDRNRLSLQSDIRIKARENTGAGLIGRIAVITTLTSPTDSNNYYSSLQELLFERDTNGEILANGNPVELNERVVLEHIANKNEHLLFYDGIQARRLERFGTTFQGFPTAGTWSISVNFKIGVPANYPYDLEYFVDNVAVQYLLAQCLGYNVSVDLATGQLPTSQDDVILGTNYDDAIYGMGGDDIICGLGGNDHINGGRGQDWIDAGHGDDEVLGGNDADRVNGGEGADLIFGGPGDDELYGDAGDDFIKGNSGNDEIDGGDGIDKLLGGAGNDIIITGPGGNVGTTQYVTGGNGDDFIVGGTGADVLRGDAGQDTIWGYEGDDKLYGGGGNDVIIGGLGNDLLRGNGANDILKGGLGDDQLDGLGGNDLLYGGPGTDRLTGSTGNDRLFGDQGNDTLHGGGGNDDLIGGADTDDCDGAGGNADTATSCESQTNTP